MDSYLDATVDETPIEDIKPATHIAEVLETEIPRDGEGRFTTGKRLTRKQAIFVKELIDNPKQSATEAARKAYNISTDGSARAVASENLTKPNIIMALGDSARLFESVIVGVARDWGQAETPRKREIALDAAKFGHDKIFGKATVKVEQQTQIVQIAINLTGDGEEPPEELLTTDSKPV